MRFPLFMLSVLWGGPVLVAQEGEFLLALGEVRAQALGPFALPVLADAPVSYQGFSLSVRYPPTEISVERIDVVGTIIEAIRADFVHAEALPAEAIFNIGVLADALPPFDGTLIPAVGFPLAVATVRGRVLREAPGEVVLPFNPMQERPAVPTVFSVENRPVAPQRLIEGRIRIDPPPRVAAFIRGDANLDRRVDIADAIYLLAWYFTGGTGPGCEDAADANSDDVLDVSDSIFLLHFLFMEGRSPLPPQGTPGPDPFTRGRLGCDHPLEWQTVKR
jgi:hypothetical protein